VPQQQWHRIEELFHAALEREPGDRDAFITEACGNDQELKRKVQALLERDQESQSAFLDLAAVELLTETSIGDARIELEDLLAAPGQEAASPEPAEITGRTAISALSGVAGDSAAMRVDDSFLETSL
jgi:hypothetical protein